MFCSLNLLSFALVVELTILLGTSKHLMRKEILKWMLLFESSLQTRRRMGRLCAKNRAALDFPRKLVKKKKIFTAGISALHIQHSQQTHDSKRWGVHSEWDEMWSVDWLDPWLLPSLWEGSEGEKENLDRDSWGITEFLMSVTQPLAHSVSGGREGVPREFRASRIAPGAAFQLLSLSTPQKLCPQIPGEAPTPGMAKVDLLHFWISKFCSPLNSLKCKIINVHLQAVIFRPCQRYVIWLCM